MESGIYKRPLFGDLIMAGIACGIRKRILIFNTHKKTCNLVESYIAVPRRYIQEYGFTKNDIQQLTLPEEAHTTNMQDKNPGPWIRVRENQWKKEQK